MFTKKRTTKYKCNKKIAHSSRENAIIALKKSRKSTNYKYFSKSYVYKCNNCGKWHISSPNKTEKIDRILSGLKDKYHSYAEEKPKVTPKDLNFIGSSFINDSVGKKTKLTSNKGETEVEED